MKSTTCFRLLFTIALVAFAVSISVGFTVWHVNKSVGEQTQSTHKLELKVDRLDQKVEDLSEENDRLKKIVGELYRYNQSIVKGLPEEKQNLAEKAGNTVGDLIKGFIF